MQRERAETRSRDASLAALYRREAAQMCAPAPQQPDRDLAVLLPILLLLVTEGADKRLLLALVYILM